MDYFSEANELRLQAASLRAQLAERDKQIAEVDEKIATIRRRLNHIRKWIDAEAPYVPGDQHHLDANTPERAYWHYGYQAALADVLRLVEGGVSRKSDNATPSK